MKRKLLLQIAVPVTTALFVAGCASSSPETASYNYYPDQHNPAQHYPAQGAPVVEQRTEVTAASAPAAEQRTEVTAASSAVETAPQADILLHKEEIVVSKKEVSNGGVLIRTVVSSETENHPIELRREEYVIERIPASEAPAREAAARSAGTVFEGKEIYIPLTREEPVASKRAVLSEKVQFGKRTETDRQVVSIPVRSENIELTKVAGKASGNYWQEPAPVAASAPGQANSLNLLREEMLVGKTVVDNGGVKLQKIVHTEVATQPVELKREEFTIDRSPVSAQEVASGDFSPREIRVDLSREQPLVSTRTEPTEWVRVSKQIHTDTKTVTGTLRKENIEVVKLTPEQNAVAMGGTGASGKSGATVISESGKEITIKGKATCAKCQLHQATSCQNIIQVQNGERTWNYYLVNNATTRSFHENLGKQVTATGVAEEVAGNIAFTPSRMQLLSN